MIQVDAFIKRLEVILDYHSLSPSAFADRIGVQRSALSHLLSGRNKPSLDLIMKITEAFPEAELYWLLYGKGSFPAQGAPAGIHPTLPDEAMPDQTPDLFSGAREIRETRSGKPEEEKNAEKDTRNEEIDRVVIFFRDGSFKNYTP